MFGPTGAVGGIAIGIMIADGIAAGIATAAGATTDADWAFRAAPRFTNCYAAALTGSLFDAVLVTACEVNGAVHDF